MTEEDEKMFGIAFQEFFEANGYWKKQKLFKGLKFKERRQFIKAFDEWRLKTGNLNFAQKAQENKRVRKEEFQEKKRARTEKFQENKRVRNETKAIELEEIKERGRAREEEFQEKERARNDAEARKRAELEGSHENPRSFRLVGNILAGTVILLACMIVIVAGYLALSAGPEVYGSAPTSAPTYQEYQDSEYLSWATDTLELMISDMSLIAYSYDDLDAKGVEIYSEMLCTDANKALNEIDQFDVSPALKPSKNEFELALRDFKQAGYYGALGARNYDVSDTDTSSDYLESGIKHSHKATNLLPIQ